MRDWTRRAIAAGHYLGPHSDGHLLYADWKDRTQSLVSKERFQADLHRNVAELSELGALTQRPISLIPPFEWHNADHSAWAKELGCQMINFTPGTGSQHDYATVDWSVASSADTMASSSDLAIARRTGFVETSMAGFRS